MKGWMSMCTALSFRTKDHYFGRNLDLERGYGEAVVIMPRNFPLPFRFVADLDRHYAMIGMAAVAEDFPLYFEATNEKGLSMAGLNFPRNAFYQPFTRGKDNVAPFELIPYLLGACADTGEVRTALEKINVVNCNFSEALPVSPLHWIVSDREDSLTLECTEAGTRVYENPFGVLTNNPAFDFHTTNVSQYMSMHPGAAENRLSPGLPLENFSLGLGGVGLPGDLSSPSRFVRAVFVKENAVCDGSEKESVNQFFHMLQAVAMPRGCVMVESGEYEYTRYSSCCNTDRLIYYYTTYQNLAVRKVEMGRADTEGCELAVFAVEE